MSAKRERFTNAIDELMANEVHVHINKVACCLTDAALEVQEDVGDQPAAWSYGGQGFFLVWQDDNTPVFVDIENENLLAIPAYDITVWHCNSGAKFTYETFTKFGFNAEWDGDKDGLVKVDLA